MVFFKDFLFKYSGKLLKVNDLSHIIRSKHDKCLVQK